MFRPLSRSHHQGVQNPWKLQSHCGDLLVCCYVYVFMSRLNNNKLIQKLICAFCWFYFFFMMLAHLEKSSITASTAAYKFLVTYVHHFPLPGSDSWLPPRSRWELCSSGSLLSEWWYFITDVSGQPIGTILRVQEYKTKPLKVWPISCPINFGKKLPLLAA